MQFGTSSMMMAAAIVMTVTMIVSAVNMMDTFDTFISGIRSDNSKLNISSNFYQNHLDRHNVYRRKHGAPPLKLNSTISKFAQEWAEHCADSGSIAHRQQQTYGENIHAGGEPYLAMNGTEPVYYWYIENKYYHWFGGEPADGSYHKSGHFTQVIWKNTEQIGVGIAINNNGTFACVVSNYYPKGNIIGEYANNVLPVQ